MPYIWLSCAIIPPSFEARRSERQTICLTFIYASLSNRSGRNRWIRVRARDELGTDRNQRVLPSTRSLQAKGTGSPVRTAHEKLGRRVHSAVSFELFPSFTRRPFPAGIRDGGRREPREPRPCSLEPGNVCRYLAAVGIPRQVQESPVRGSNEGVLGCSASPTLPGFCAGVSRLAES
jgi:hypothetical protein